MNKKYKFGGLLLLLLALALLIRSYFHRHPIAVLDPAGPIAHQEKSLIITSLLLSIIIVVPVFSMTIFITWKYRASNTKAKYSPEFDHSRVLETIWWLVPTILIFIISVINWNSTHQLDPYRALASKKAPITIQVVALDWKWLFIYPKQNIASVNFAQFPADTPVNFQITSDAPMNSFWIPRLGSQIYAMPGMVTQLNLLADSPGSYRGSSANISGEGFAGMKFIAKASTQTDFQSWVSTVKKSPNSLSVAAYNNLLKPSQNNPPSFYSGGKQNLYNLIVLKYMVPGIQNTELQE